MTDPQPAFLLPPLPKPQWPAAVGLGGVMPDAYTAEQMQDYARAAIVAYIYQEELP